MRRYRHSIKCYFYKNFNNELKDNKLSKLKMLFLGRTINLSIRERSLEIRNFIKGHQRLEINIVSGLCYLMFLSGFVKQRH